MKAVYFSEFWVLFFGLCFSLIFVPLASMLAVRVGLVDNPNKRKRHVGVVPLAGGIVIVSGLCLGATFLPKSDATWSIVFMSVPLFLLGALDDRFDLSARIRLAVQLAVGILLIAFFEISIRRLDGAFGDEPLVLTATASVFFTLLCWCGVLNAINMTDGIDGLLGSLASISLISIFVLSVGKNFNAEASIALLVVGLLAGFLTYNLGAFGGDRKVFLGDSGSMLVGLILLVLLITLSQGEDAAITPTSAGWILGVPLLDTVSVMVRRVISGRSPLAAGRDHFHHILQDLGLSRELTLAVLVSIHIVFVSVGVLANYSGASQYVFLWLFIFLTILQYFGISLAVRKIAKGRITEHGIKPLRPCKS